MKGRSALRRDLPRLIVAAIFRFGQLGAERHQALKMSRELYDDPPGCVASGDIGAFEDASSVFTRTILSRAFSDFYAISITPGDPIARARWARYYRAIMHTRAPQ